MPYCPITGTLGYILSKDKQKVLLVNRNKRKNDTHLGKYNGLGGKMEKNESITTCMKREIKEEAGIDCIKIELRGSINWTGFGSNGEDWLGFIFLITEFSGVVKTENEEGTLHWIDIDKIYEFPIWEGDKHYLPMIFDNNPKQFHGLMPYINGKPKSWEYDRI